MVLLGEEGGTVDGKPQPTGAAETAADRGADPGRFRDRRRAAARPGEGEVLVRGIYLSLDPYMRGRISGQRSYARPVEVGAVIEGRVVGEVARSRDPAFREGDYVLGGYGWQLYSAVPARACSSSIRPTRRSRPPSACSACRGSPPMSGSTRSAGRSAARPWWSRRPRGRSVPSSASSPNATGARVVGIAGGADKCRWVEAELGFDTCIDHRRSGPRRGTRPRPVLKGSTSIGRMSAGRCSRRCFRGSTISAAWSCAAWSRNTTTSSRGPAPI